MSSLPDAMLAAFRLLVSDIEAWARIPASMPIVVWFGKLFDQIDGWVPPVVWLGAILALPFVLLYILSHPRVR